MVDNLSHILVIFNQVQVHVFVAINIAFEDIHRSAYLHSYL